MPGEETRRQGEAVFPLDEACRLRLGDTEDDRRYMKYSLGAHYSPMAAVNQAEAIPGGGPGVPCMRRGSR